LYTSNLCNILFRNVVAKKKDRYLEKYGLLSVQA
jgi:hypothetical protein